MAITVQSSAHKVQASAELTVALQDVIAEQEQRLECWKSTQALLGMFGLGLPVSSFSLKHSDSMDISALQVTIEVAQELAEVLRSYESFLANVRWYDLPADEGAGKTASVLVGGVQLTVTVRERTPEVTSVVLQNFVW